MNTTYKTDGQSSLHMYIECTSAAEHCNINDKMYTHSEFDTLWDSTLGEWYEKGYYKHYHFEVLKGNSTVMFKFECPLRPCVAELHIICTLLMTMDSAESSLLVVRLV